MIIDAHFYHKTVDEFEPNLKPFKESPRSGVTLDEDIRASNDNGIGITADDEDSYLSHAGSTDSTALTNDQLLLASSTVTAFKLKTKVWSDLEVDKILEVDWIPDLMSRLVLDQDIKDLIVALIDYKTTQAIDDKQNFDDFIPGKGKGIVMLLCGPPGVGKTLTAEAVSEHSKSPLYRVSVQDLGSEVSAMESALQKAMERCSHWNAVLLLDEADVFLEQRSVNSLERNELVSSKLRPARPAHSTVKESWLTSRGSLPPRDRILRGRHDSHNEPRGVDRPGVRVAHRRHTHL